MPDPPLAPPYADIQADFPDWASNQGPYAKVSFAIVVWQDGRRLFELLQYVRPYFETVAVAVQASTDDTLEVARRFADVLVTDQHRGFGDASFGPLLLPQVPTRWTFKVDADEWPTPALLKHLGLMVSYCERSGTDGLWIPFHSWVEGGEYAEQHSHLRLFETRLGWPGTLHSRPPAKHDQWWSGPGHIRHVRSLDEMMQDYLSYYAIGLGNEGWTAHNRLMMQAACSDAARRKGWAFVQSFPWWSQVEAIAFAEEKPWLG